METLQERLRHLVSLNNPDAGGPYGGYAASLFIKAASEAADALDAKDAEIEKLKEALEPFALTAEVDIGSTETDEDIFQQASHNAAPHITVGHFRHAHAALAGEQ